MASRRFKSRRSFYAYYSSLKENRSKYSFVGSKPAAAKAKEPEGEEAYCYCGQEEHCQVCWPASKLDNPINWGWAIWGAMVGFGFGGLFVITLIRMGGRL